MEATHESGYKAKFFLLPTLSWLFVFIFLAVNENLTFWAQKQQEPVLHPKGSSMCCFPGRVRTVQVLPRAVTWLPKWWPRATPASTGVTAGWTKGQDHCTSTGGKQGRKCPGPPGFCFHTVSPKSLLELAGDAESSNWTLSWWIASSWPLHSCWSL